jgi:Virulence-associated protein E/Domain of unknown function (DUF3854)
MSLTPADLEMFRRLGIDPELLAHAGIERVTDQGARQKFGLKGTGDNAGIVFHYVDAAGIRRTCRLRRDHPDMENGKPVKKYLAPYGDRRHAYIVPGDHSLAQDTDIPVVLVEAEKSALALRAFADRTGRQLLPIALGGCWAWRARIGKVENSKGERVDEVGPLLELGICRDGRKVYVLLDANCASNPAVQAARNALVRQLLKQKAGVHVLDLPAFDGVNGPDDYIGLYGDDAMAKLLNTTSSKVVDWGSLLIYRQTKGTPSQPERLLANAMTALRYAPEWEGVLGFNEFSQQVVANRPTPGGKQVGSSWADADDSLATEWLQHEAGIFVGSNTVAEAVQTVARENGFHPVRTYLQSLVWDNVSRIETWLTDYLGCTDSQFIRAVSSRWLISAVARIFQPGCQADHVLLLEGPQGARKSSALRALVGDEWFADHIADLGSKDSRLDLLGKWIIEMSELVSMRRGEIEKVKAFLTARTDHFRPPYGRRAVDVPRQNVFAASTNEEQPFVDSSGNRRFWPVRCGQIDVDGIRRDRDQLWAEVYHRFKQGEAWWLDTPELNQLAQHEQDERYEPGVWDDIILEWIDDPHQRKDLSNGITIPVDPWDSSEPGKVTITDILIHAIGKDKDRLTQIDRNQVARCLAHDSWQPRQERRGSLRGKRFYVRSKR